MSKKRILISSGIANTFEWYDYALFGNFAGLIGQKFFPESDPHSAILNAFLVFAVGYLMRPLGGVFFGIIGDKYGRRFALASSVMCMSIPTAIMGLLPTYESFGYISSILMVLMRMLQGLSMGGALTGSISFLIEHTSQKQRGIVGSVPMAGICLGILLGTLVSIGTRHTLTDVEFDSWGWRIPFLLGIFIMFAGFYIIKYTEETPLFNELQERGKLSKSPLTEVFSNYWYDMIMSVFINSTGSVVFYFQAVYVSNYLKYTRNFDAHLVDKLSAIGYLIMAFATLFAGKISDIFGRRKTFVLIILGIVSTIFFITHELQYGSLETVIFYQLILAIFAAAYIGPEPALQAEFYPTKVRSTALSISYNFSTSLFGGTTPYVIAYLYHMTGSLYGCASYVIITSLLSLVGLYFYKNRSKI